MITAEQATLSAQVQSLAVRMRALESRGSNPVAYGRYSASGLLTGSGVGQNPGATGWTLQDDQDTPVTVDTSNNFVPKFDGVYVFHMITTLSAVPTGRFILYWNVSGADWSRSAAPATERVLSVLGQRALLVTEVLQPVIYYQYSTAPTATSHVAISYLGPIRKATDEEEAT